MKFPGRVSCVIAIIVAFGGCATNSTPKYIFDPVYVDLNPNPKSNYVVDVTFDGVDATGFYVGAYALYRVTNRDCVAVNPSAAIGGLQLLPEYERRFKVRETAGGKKSLTISLDALMPENYFGLGMCNWALDGLTVEFSNGSGRFVAGLSADQIKATQPISSYYLMSDLNRPIGEAYVFGEKADFYLATMGPQFTATLQSILATGRVGEAK
jgi:hypothetical protein